MRPKRVDIGCIDLKALILEELLEFGFQLELLLTAGLGSIVRGLLNLAWLSADRPSQTFLLKAR